MIPRNMNTTMFLFEKCLRTIIKRALNLYKGLFRMRKLHMLIQGIFLIKLLVTGFALIGLLALVLLHVIMHCILLLLYLRANRANIESLLICFIFVYHLLAFQMWVAGFNFYCPLYSLRVYLNNYMRINTWI